MLIVFYSDIYDNLILLEVFNIETVKTCLAFCCGIVKSYKSIKFHLKYCFRGQSLFIDLVLANCKLSFEDSPIFKTG